MTARLRYPVAKLLRAPVEALIHRSSPGPVLQAKDFSWTQSVERLSWKIQDEDSVEHEAWNHTPHVRVILFVDFERPLPSWLSPINLALLSVFSRTKAAQNAERTVLRTAW
jgi:hypothetical protein